MSDVRIAHASLNEAGGVNGGQAGDQTGGEVCIRPWYLHSKGWVIYRANDPVVADKIAENAEKAAKNDLIGYDQAKRSTLYNHVKSKGFDCAKVTAPVSTDCSALDRVCICYAGIQVANFTTVSIHTVLPATGQFTKLTDRKYTTSSDYLRRGDILVTPVKAHTVIVLDDGAAVAGTTPAAIPVSGTPIARGKCIDPEYANVRRTPNGTKVGEIPCGHYMDIYAEENDWYKINYDNLFAYIYKPLVEIVDEDKIDPLYIAYCNDTALNVRKSPNGTKIDVLNYGDEIRVISEEGDWLMIDMDGEIAFVYDDYVDRASVIKFWGTVNDTDLNIRAQANSSSKKLGQFFQGDRIYIVDESGNWYKIRYCGQDAYVYKTYVDKDGEINNDIVTGTVTASSLYVRKGPNSVLYGKLGSLKNGTVVEIYEEKNGWYRISYGEGFGWVSGKHIQKH